MHVSRVNPNSPSDVKQFIEFPFWLYRDSSNWVPPLVSGEYQLFDQGKHPFYQHSTAQFYLAHRENEVVGRIAVLHNRNYNRYHDSTDAQFGYFECVDDEETAQALFDAAFTWTRRQGLDGIIGPKGLLGGEGAGILVDGFDLRPPLGVSYHAPYYCNLIRNAGFIKDTDFLTATVDTSYRLPDRVRQIAAYAQQRRGYWVKRFSSTSEARVWVDRVLTAHQKAFGGNKTYYPPTPAETSMLVDTLLRVLDLTASRLIMVGDEIIGFVLGVRDVSAGLQRARGRMWPIGWFHLLRELRSTQLLNLNGLGLLPGYRGVGADAVLLATLEEALRATNYKQAYLVQTEESNSAMVTEVLRLGVTWRQRHRSYRRIL